MTFQKLFRDKKGELMPVFSSIEGITFADDPLELFIMLARYKFAARLLNNKQTVLDAGCAHGLGTIFLSKFAAQVTGGDIDREMIVRNKKEYEGVRNVDFKFLNLLDISSHRKKYDAVVSMDVIEHFTKRDTEKVAENYARLLKPRGFAILGTPNIASKAYASKRRLQTHLHEFSPDEFRFLLSKHFRNVFIFSMTDEVVSLSFSRLAWYLMALCVS